MNVLINIIGTQIPWTFAWGNHDCENFNSGDFFSQFDELELFFESLPKCKYKSTRKFMEAYPGAEIKDSLKEIDAEI